MAETGHPKSKVREVYFEFVSLGSAVKVTAIDGETASEGSVLVPASAHRTAMEQAALRKLDYVMSKHRREA